MALAIIGGSPDRFAVFSKLHRRALAESGFEAANVPIAVHGHGHIGDTSDAAADEYFPSYAAAMTRIGRERGWGPMTRSQFDAMRTPEGSLVIGNPEEVAAKILRWGEVLDLDRFMLHISVGTLQHDQVMSVIERLGTDVAPIVSAG